MPPSRRRPRGHNETLPSGKFRATVYAGVDPLTGGELRLKETHESWDEARIALTKLQPLVDENKHPKSSITVGEAIQKWMEVAELEETSRDRYEDLIRLYIAPTLGTSSSASSTSSCWNASTPACISASTCARRDRRRTTSTDR